MKAIVYDKHNAPDVLTLREVAKPVPGDDQVLVKVVAVSLNAADYRSMSLGIIPKHKIFGGDIAGRVESIGKNITRFQIGDEVFGDIISSGWGGLAEYVAVTESVLARKPADISFIDTASLPIAGITALQGLRDQGNLQPGQNVLIYGAAGGVGTFAVQLAKVFSAHVTAVCSTRNVELVKSMGADRVIDYTKEDFARIGQRYHVILAVNGKRTMATYMRALHAGGYLVGAGGAFSQIIAMMLAGPILSLGNKKAGILTAKTNKEDLEFLARLVEEGKLKPVIEKIYPLEEAPQAMDYLMQGHARGKVVISIE